MTEKISTWQAGTLLGSSIISTAILFPPVLVVQEAGRDAWLAFILAAVFGALIALLAVEMCIRDSYNSTTNHDHIVITGTHKITSKNFIARKTI